MGTASTMNAVAEALGLSLTGCAAIPAPYRELLDVRGPDALDPALLAARWRMLPPAGAEPFYLRPADATVPGKPKSALPRLRAAR